jgi:hypothetical protein
MQYASPPYLSCIARNVMRKSNVSFRQGATLRLHHVSVSLGSTSFCDWPDVRSQTWTTYNNRNRRHPTRIYDSLASIAAFRAVIE